MEGTGIMISNSLKPHIHKIQKHNGGAIGIDIFFKNDFKFRIISVYLSSGNIARRNETQTKVIHWIQEAQRLKLHPIVLGDFNIDNSKTKPSHTKSRLINFLQANNLYDLANHTNNYSFTWYNNQSYSRIDYIWCHQPLIPYLTKFKLEEASTTTESDHKILISNWTFPFANSRKQRHSSKTSRRIYNYKLMNKEKWEEFTNKVNSNLTQNKVPLNPDTTDSLKTNWHKIQISLINAALEHIPNKKQKIQNFHNTYSPKATSLHNNLKLLGQIIRQVKSSLNNNSTIPPNISQQINKINQQQDLQIEHPPTNPNMILTWINNTQKE